jgi:hypothetical protein
VVHHQPQIVPLNKFIGMGPVEFVDAFDQAAAVGGELMSHFTLDGKPYQKK